MLQLPNPLPDLLNLEIDADDLLTLSATLKALNASNPGSSSQIISLSTDRKRPAHYSLTISTILKPLKQTDLF